MRRHIQDDVTSERHLLRLVLCCHVIFVEWTCVGHRSNVCDSSGDRSAHTRGGGQRRVVKVGYGNGCCPAVGWGRLSLPQHVIPGVKETNNTTLQNYRGFRNILIFLLMDGFSRHSPGLENVMNLKKDFANPGQVHRVRGPVRVPEACRKQCVPGNVSQFWRDSPSHFSFSFSFTLALPHLLFFFYHFYFLLFNCNCNLTSITRPKM